MYDPLTTSAGVAAAGAGVSLATMFPEATPPVMLCSLAGAALYVLTGEHHQFWKQIVFAFVSFVGGIYCADFISEILAGLLNTGLARLRPPISITVSPAIGALVGAVICITALMKILARVRSYKGGNAKGERE